MNNSTNFTIIQFRSKYVIFKPNGTRINLDFDTKHAAQQVVNLLTNLIAQR